MKSPRILWAIGLSLVSFVRTEAQGADRVVLVPQVGMEQATSAAFSKDGKLIAVGSWDGKATLWDTQSGKQIRNFATTSTMRTVAFSPDGNFLLTGGDENTALLWNLRTGERVRVFKGHLLPVMSVSISPDGHRMATGSLDRTVLLWNMDTGEVLKTLRGGQFFSVVFSPDGHKLLAGGNDHAATLWDTETGAVLQTFKGHSDSVTGVAFSADGKQVLTGSLDKTARLWDTATGQQLRMFTGHTNYVLGVAFSPDDEQILTASADGTSKLWDTNTGKELEIYRGHTWMVNSVAFSPDGAKVLTASNDHSAIVWETDTARKVLRLAGGSGGVTSLAVSSDGQHLLTGSEDATATVWDLSTGQPANRWSGDPSKEIMSVAFSPDGHMALTGSYETATTWDIQSGQTLHSFPGQTNWVKSAVFSSDGSKVLTESFNAAELWDAKTGAHLHSFAGHPDQVTHVAFSADGKRILTNGDNQAMRVWNVQTGEEIRSFEMYSFCGVFSANGEQVLIGESPNASLWDIATGTETQKFRGHDWRVSSVAFSSDSQQVLTGSWDHTAKLWNTATGKLIQTFTGHVNKVTSAVYSADGRFVITGSDDTTTRIWDVASGKQLLALMTFANGGWVVSDDEGRFDANNLDGGAPLTWVASNDPLHAIPLEIFMRDYYTPGLLARVMKGEKLPEVRSIAEIKNRVQPEVKVVSVAPSEKTPGRVDVTVHAASVTDKGVKSGLQDLRLFRDGQMVADGYREGALKDGDFVFRDVMLKSDAKKVTFTAYAFNSERIKSATASLDYEPKTPPNTAPKQRAFLLQVGVNHTSAKGCELKYSVNDAETMSAALSEKLKTQGFEVLPVKLESEAGTDASGAAKDLIRARLKEIAAQATPDDVFFMSFSGHGYSAVGGAFYILPSSLEGDCSHVDDALLKSAISADELADWLRPIDAGEMTLILDACYSAESVQAGDFKPGPMGSRGLGQVAYDKRMRVLAASQSDAVAHEYDYLHQGLLNYVLVKDGLEKGSADWKPKDGQITVGEWLSYAAAQVPQFKPSAPTGENKGITVKQETAATKPVGQVPALFDFSRTDSLVLAK